LTDFFGAFYLTTKLISPILVSVNHPQTTRSALDIKHQTKKVISCLEVITIFICDDWMLLHPQSEENHQIFCPLAVQENFNCRKIPELIDFLF
jgi:hypothetical protein